MQFSKDDFASNFIQESLELINIIDTQILEYKSSPNNALSFTEILRALHTIKGSARMLNFSAVQKLSHAMEDLVKKIENGTCKITPEIISVLLACTARTKTALRHIEKTGNDKIPVSSHIELCRKISNGNSFNLEEIKAELESDLMQEISLQTENSQSTQDFLANQINPFPEILNIKSVRTDLSVLDKILHSFDDLILRHFRIKHSIDSSLQSDLPKSFEEEINQYENLLFNLQNSLINLRMLPLSIILHPLKLEIEKDAPGFGKEVNLEIPDSNLMLDKFILEHLENVLIQIVLNSLVHGIETGEERKAKNKSEKGLIKIKVNKVQNRMLISISDDGRGLDYEKIRAKALATKNFYDYTKDQILKMSEKELQKFIFESGFTTQDKADNFSGRGIGLDIVKNEMEKIKGKITVSSKKDLGTTFELNLPLSLANQQGIFVTSGTYKFMISSHYISEITDYSSANIFSRQKQNYIKVHNEDVPVYFLSSILNLKKQNTFNSIIIADYLDSKIGIAVDSVEQFKNVTVNPMPKILQSVEAFQGIVYDEYYSLIPVLDLPFIIKKLKSLLSYEIKKYEMLNDSKKKRILIVDDSAETRQIEQSIFTAAGYECEGASDGIEALDILHTHHFDAMVTDINMHRMDGLLLIKNVRNSGEFTSLPIIVVTGAYSQDDRQKFINAGADDFFTKADFKREKLIKMMENLLNSQSDSALYKSS